MSDVYDRLGLSLKLVAQSADRAARAVERLSALLAQYHKRWRTMSNSTWVLRRAGR